MRVTSKMMTNNFLRDMNVNLNRMQRLQTQLTSGKEFKRPSDDPFKVARSMQLYTDINTNKQYNENIGDTINWLDTTDTAVSQVNDVFQRVHELMISAGNGGYSQDERKAIKDEINERVSEISQILNTSFDGKYIFGGSRGTEKPTDVSGGLKYKNAPAVSVTNFDEWEGKTVTFDDGTNRVDVTFPADIKNIGDIESAMNTAFRANPAIKMEAKLNIADNAIMLISENDDAINVSTSADIPDIKDKLTTIEKAIIEDSGNAKLKYHGIDGDITDNEMKMLDDVLRTEISAGVTIGYNITAVEIIEFKDDEGNTFNMIETLNSIVNHLDGRSSDGGESLDDDALDKLLSEDLSAIKKIMGNISTVRSKVGAMQNRMDSAKLRNEDENFNMKEILSKTEDIDIAEKTMEYATMQTVYMASLQTSAKVIQPSLIDFLR